MCKSCQDSGAVLVQLLYALSVSSARLTCSKTGLPNWIAFSICRSRSGMAKLSTRRPFCASMFFTHLLA